MPEQRARGSDTDIGKRDRLEYMQAMLDQLHGMAPQHDDMLVYLLEMALLECGDQLRAVRAASKPPAIRLAVRNS